MQTQTLTVTIEDAPLRDRSEVGMRVRRSIDRAIDASPHLVLDMEVDAFRGTVVVVLATEHDMANATTIVYEVVRGIEGASLPDTLVIGG